MSFETAQHAYLESEQIRAQSRWLDLTLDAPGGTRTVRSHVLEVGAGPPLLFVHGGGGLAAAWAPLMAHLRGYRLIAPDRPGCGLSSGFDYRGVDFRAHAVQWFERLLDELGLDSVAVVANSMGARWTTWFALEHPGRVTGLAMLGIPALLLDTSAPLPMRLLGVRGIGRMMMAVERPSPATARALWQRLGHRPGDISGELLALTEELARRPDYGLSWRTLLRACLRVRGPRPGLSLDHAQLSRLPMPITLAVGNNDPFGGVEVAERAVASMPRGTLAVAGTGHLPWLDEPARYAEIVRAGIEAPHEAALA